MVKVVFRMKSPVSASSLPHVLLSGPYNIIIYTKGILFTYCGQYCVLTLCEIL